MRQGLVAALLHLLGILLKNFRISCTPYFELPLIGDEIGDLGADVEDCLDVLVDCLIDSLLLCLLALYHVLLDVAYLGCHLRKKLK